MHPTQLQVRLRSRAVAPFTWYPALLTHKPLPSPHPRSQVVVNHIDLMCWAIICGSLDLAHIFLVRCRCPLRAALIGQSVCEKIRNSKYIRETELMEAETRFSRFSIGVLDMLKDQEAARKLLTAEVGDFATLGADGEDKKSLLDLALDLGNKEFVSHRYCQAILDEAWCGRSPQGGLVRFSHTPGMVWTYLQVFCFFLRLVPLAHNDLYESDEQQQSALGAEGEAAASSHISELKQLVEIWKIPLMKRATQTLSMMSFLMLCERRATQTRRGQPCTPRLTLP